MVRGVALYKEKQAKVKHDVLSVQFEFTRGARIVVKVYFIVAFTHSGCS
jgi:hypothetical protein